MEESLFLLPTPSKSKIVPLDGTHLLERHISHLETLMQGAFGKNILAEEIREPLVRAGNCDRVPGALPIYLLAPAGTSSREIYLLFHELVVHYLAPGEQLEVLSSRCYTFSPLYFCELIVSIENEKELFAILQGLPTLAEEIKLGLLSKGYTKHLLEMKRLSLGGKISYIYENIVSAIRRFPKRFEHDIFREVQHFLVHCREDFRNLRDTKHLSRIIRAHYLFQKALSQNCTAHPEKRHLYFKLFKTHLHYPFGSKKVLGIAIALNSLSEYECFEERHILKAVSQLIPSCRSVRDSFYVHRHDENRISIVYLEVEKGQDEDFTLAELSLLKKKLSYELKNSIEPLTPSLFIPRNEEELYRNIIALSQELKYVHDLPQAMITFQQQKEHVLQFNIILMRLLKKNTPSLEKLSLTLDERCRFVPQKVAPLGYIRKKYLKEANVFSLEVKSSHFLRKDCSVDLLKARQSVVRSLEKMVGPFRDFNGGLLWKQNEKLEALKTELGEEGHAHESLVDTFFYALTPSVMQTLIAPKIMKALIASFLKALDTPLPQSTGLLVETQHLEGTLAVVVKASHKEIEETLGAAFKELELTSYSLASASIEVEGTFYLGYLALNLTEQEKKNFLLSFDSVLTDWSKKQQRQQIVRLALPHPLTSLDPRIDADRTSGIPLKMLFEGLMRIELDGSISYGIAHSVDINATHDRYIFTLKETYWSDGTPVTAYDFECAWKKILEPSFKAPYSFLLFPIKNAEAAKSGECSLHDVGVAALDTYTLAVDLESPSPYFLGMTAHWTYAPVSHNIDKCCPGWAYRGSENYVSNGPFKMESWKATGALEVTANPHYWDASRVKLRKIEMKIIEDDSKALEMFREGQLHFVGRPISNIPLRESASVKESSLCKINPFTGLFWLQFNTSCLPFRHPLMRKAFAAAINRKYLIHNALKSEDLPALGLYPSEAQEGFLRDGDPVLARSLFAKGLAMLGLSLDALPPILISHSDIEEHEVLHHEIGRMWREILGVQVNYERLPWPVFFDTLRRRDYMVGGLTCYARSEDPLYYLDLLCTHRESLLGTKWDNKHFDTLMREAKQTLDLSEKERLGRMAEAIVLEEMPLVPLLLLKGRYLKCERLKNVLLSTIGQMEFREAYLAPS